MVLGWHRAGRSEGMQVCNGRHHGARCVSARGRDEVLCVVVEEGHCFEEDL